MIRAVAALCALALAACSSLVGEPLHSLTYRGGPPQDVVPLQDGTRAYFWRNTDCALAVTVDAQGIVTAYEFAGARCEAMRKRFLVE